MTDNNPNPRDVRLAAVLTKHHRAGDTAGVQEIVRETAETDRASELLRAVLDLHGIAIIQLRTPTGAAYLESYVQGIAAIKPTDPHSMDIHRAARILDGHGRDDFDQINEVIRAARAEKRCTQTLIVLLDLYTVILPELSSTAGSKWLDECVAASHTEEFKEGNE